MIRRYTFTLACVCMLFVVTKAFAQIPNASFENWTDGNPDGWNTLNTSGSGIVYVTPTGNAHQGNFAAQSNAMSPGGSTFLASFIYTGTQAHPYFACGCRPDALHFWYQLHPANNESLSVSLGGKQGNTPVAAGFASFATPTGVYAEGIVNMTYAAAGNMDSMSISFIMSAPATDGSFFIVDDLSWGAFGTAVENVAQTAAALESVTPNPTKYNANIVYSVTQASNVQLSIYDATGRLVKTFVNQQQAPGRYKAVEDMTGMAAGIYICRLSVNEQAFSKTFVVTP